MKTRALLLALPLAALAACAKNNASVEAVAICAPPDDADVCSFSATCDAQTIAPNMIDTGTTQTLWIFLQVNNQLPNNRNDATGKTNTNDAWVQEYEIEYSGLGLPTARGPILGSANVPAGGSSVISVLIVDDVTGATLSTLTPPLGIGYIDFVAHLRLRGAYGDTTTFETGEFLVPIRWQPGAFPLPAPGCPDPADFRVFCPKYGQLPASTKCISP